MAVIAIAADAVSAWWPLVEEAASESTAEAVPWDGSPHMNFSCCDRHAATDGLSC